MNTKDTHDTLNTTNASTNATNAFTNATTTLRDRMDAAADRMEKFIFQDHPIVLLGIALAVCAILHFAS